MDDRRLNELFRMLEEGIEFAEPEPAFAGALFGRLQAAARPPWGPRPMVLLVAALITVAMAVGIVIGSRLIELPSKEDTLLPVHGLDCPPAEPLAEGVILRAHVGDPDDTGRPGSRLTLYEDGTVLVGPEYADPYVVEPFPALADGGSGHSYQRLSATGIERVRTAVAESGLLARGCHLDLLAASPLRGISVRSADGADAQTDWGQYGGFIRVMTAEEQAAATALIAKLEDLLGWLPSDAWIEQEPESFANELWLVSTERIAPELSYQSDVDASGIPRAALARDFLVPGGGNLLTFGAPWNEPDIQPPDAEIHFERQGRCAVVALAGARSIYRSLQALNGQFTNGRWWLADEGDWIAVGLRPLIPPHRDCSSQTLGIYDPATAAPTAPPAPEAELEVDPCAVLRLADVRTALGAAAGSDLRATAGPDFMGNSLYATCTWGAVSVALRSVSTTDDQAQGLAQMWLGEAFDETIDGRPTWLSGCMTPSPLIPKDQHGCAAAMAVFSEPYFFLVRVDTLSMEQSEVVARALIPVILANLPQAR